MDQDIPMGIRQIITNGNIDEFVGSSIDHDEHLIGCVASFRGNDDRGQS
jgi:hypothetical protein